MLKDDIETLDVTINNYERMVNAPEAWDRIKKFLEEAVERSDNTTKATICPWCNGTGRRPTFIHPSEHCKVCKGTGKL